MLENQKPTTFKTLQYNQNLSQKDEKHSCARSWAQMNLVYNLRYVWMSILQYIICPSGYTETGIMLR